MFSKACEYGIRAIIYIAHQSEQNQLVSIKEVSSAIDSPEAFTAKILQALTKDDLILSKRGANGGYSIDQQRLTNVNLQKVVKSIDGDQIYVGCGLGLQECNENQPCPLHHQFKEIRNDLYKMLAETTLFDLVNEMNDGNAVLKL